MSMPSVWRFRGPRTFTAQFCGRVFRESWKAELSGLRDGQWFAPWRAVEDRLTDIAETSDHGFQDRSNGIYSLLG